MTQVRSAISYQPIGGENPQRNRAARPAIADRYLVALAVVLMGYALDGKGFAYLGFPPVFIGEITLLFGLATLFLTPRWTRMFNISQSLVLLPFMAWGFWRTLPYVAEYQFDAMRDAVLWGYSVFAFFIAAVLLADLSRLDRLVGWYDRFSKVYLVVIPFVFVISHFGDAAVPNWPWATSTRIITIKEGDAMVHLAGIIAFWASGISAAVSWRWILMLTIDLALMNVVNRSGLIAFLFVMVVCFLVRPRSVAPWRLSSAIAMALLILAVTNVDIEVPGGKGRNISFNQVIESVFSVTKSSQAADLDGTKEWRMNWWSDIVGYTIHGPYFWGGKGYGINLADDDGYQVGDGTLRTPHNVHMTFLARSGVMGIGLWALVQITWGFGIAWGYLMSRRRGDMRWASLFLFLGCFWSAFLINASFDVFIEGPMGGIWFWTIFGVGIASLWMYRHEPDEMHS